MLKYKIMRKIFIGLVLGYLLSGWVTEEYFNDRMETNKVSNIKELHGVNPADLAIHKKLVLYWGSLFNEIDEKYIN
jgi:hypothetical protein